MMQIKKPKFFSEYVAGIVVLIDTVAIASSACLIFPAIQLPDKLPHLVEFLVLTACLIAFLCLGSVKKQISSKSWEFLILQAIITWFGIGAGVFTWLVILKGFNFSSSLTVLFWLLAMLLLLVAGRVFILLLLTLLKSKGIAVRRVLIIGKGSIVNALMKKARSSSWTGFKVTRRVDIFDLQRITRLAESAAYDEVWIYLSTEDYRYLSGIVHALRHSVADIRVIPDLFTHRMINHGTTFILNVPMVDISGSSLEGVGRVIKRIEDIVLGSLILLLVSPVMLIIALAVKVSSTGPIIFKQKRHGWGGEEILIYKFRSMKIHHEAEGVVTQAKRNDDRLTAIGGFLRRSSLDELPQFINVLQGRMSIVGPRPHAVQHNNYYKELIPNYMQRHKMKPGITGWAQVNGLRGETDTIQKMHKRVEFDIFYLENWSLIFDLKIILKTVISGFFGKSAY